MRALKDIRLKHYDYTANGYYFVTISTDYQRPCLTGEVKPVVAQFIEQISKKISGIKVDYYTIMPTHLHLIVVLNGGQLSLGEVIRRLKATTSKKAGFRLWQPNYYEHIIRNEKALTRIRQYIQNNPLVERIEFQQFYEDKKSSKGFLPAGL